MNRDEFLKEALSNIDDSWSSFFMLEQNKEYFTKLVDYLIDEYQEKEVYPRVNELFNAFKLCKLSNLKVVIIGQDPYHTPNVAHGLAFSTNDGKIPPSLRNIYKELNNDLGIQNTNPNLTSWAQQGVLLLNTALSVLRGEAKSHSKIGWQEFIVDVLKYLNEYDKFVYILWGNDAKSYKKYLDNAYLIEGAHPSPLSQKNFFNHNYFSRVNELLSEQGKSTINWRIDDV